MKLILSNLRLSERGGSEIYLITVARELQRLGHDVTLHAHAGDGGVSLASEAGLRAVADLEALGQDPDAAIVQDAAMAYELAGRFPAAPQLFVAHSGAIDLQLPPQLPDVVGLAVTLNDRVDRRLRAMARPPDRIVRLRQPVDLRLFRRPRRLPDQPRRLLALGNNKAVQRRAALRAACDAHGIEFVEMGDASDNAGDPSGAIAAADIVAGYGRCIVEAMMAGKAAYVYDHAGGDGWVTPERYPALEADGFVGRSESEPVDRSRLIADLGQYDPEMGTRNRDLAVSLHDASSHANELATLLAEIQPRPTGIDHAAEMARLVRSAWLWEAEAIRFQRECSSIDDEVARLGAQLERTRRDASERVREAEDELRRMSADRVAFEATGSYRLARFVSRTLDRFGISRR